MYKETAKYQSLLKDAGLKITPQRLAVMNAVYSAKSHPTAEDISGLIRKTHPNIAFGTVYNILDSLVQANILQRVKTEKGAMLYDAVNEKHHHLYCNESDKIEDYYDAELDQLLEEYFRNRKIEGFQVNDIKLQIVGKFTDN